MAAHPGGGILEDVGFELLHEDHVVEDDDGVILALTDQDLLKCLKHRRRRRRRRRRIWIRSYRNSTHTFMHMQYTNE